MMTCCPGSRCSPDCCPLPCKQTAKLPEFIFLFLWGFLIIVCKPQRKSPSFSDLAWRCVRENMSHSKVEIGVHLPWVGGRGPLSTGWRPVSALWRLTWLWEHSLCSPGNPSLVLHLWGGEILVNTVWEEEWNGLRMRLRDGCVKRQVEWGRGASEQHSNAHLPSSWWEKTLICRGRQAVWSGMVRGPGWALWDGLSVLHSGAQLEGQFLPWPPMLGTPPTVPRPRPVSYERSLCSVFPMPFQCLERSDSRPRPLN